jgi:biotin carboxyl carrier protein
MKVVNAMNSEYSGKILKIYFNEGDDVFDDDILFIIN